jgi:hypothetical protein
MSFVTLAEAQARVGDAVTQEMIDGLEAWLETQIGPLAGERTETYRLSERRNLGTVDGLWLSRYTDSVELASDGDNLTETTDFRLVGGMLIERVSTGAAWGNTLVATYEPNDEETLVEVIYDLLTYRTINPNLQSVRIGANSETYATGRATDPVVAAAIGRILGGWRLGRYASPFRFRSHREDRTTIEAVPS